MWQWIKIAKSIPLALVKLLSPVDSYWIRVGYLLLTGRYYESLFIPVDRIKCSAAACGTVESQHFERIQNMTVKVKVVQVQ